MNKDTKFKTSTTNSIFNVPINERYFEDYVPGAIYEFGSIKVSREDILDFNKRYDPQAFDSGLDAAREARDGGVVASGWLIAAFGMRLFVDYYLSHTAGLGSPGPEGLRWLKPVRPNDELSIRVTVINRKRSKSKPDRGIVRSFVEVMNQNHDVVTSWKASSILLCKKNIEQS